jgi:hypothetical protein
MNKSKAEELWKNSRDGLFDFAVEIADGDDIDIAALAKKMNRTASLFYGYKKAGLLWLAILKQNGATAEIWRDQLEIGYWTPLARLWINGEMDIEKVKENLIECLDEHITVDGLRAMLLVSGKRSSGIVRSLNHIVSYVEKFILDAPSLGLNCKQAEYDDLINQLRAVNETIRRLTQSQSRVSDVNTGKE